MHVQMGSIIQGQDAKGSKAWAPQKIRRLVRTVRLENFVWMGEIFPVLLAVGHLGEIHLPPLSVSLAMQVVMVAPQVITPTVQAPAHPAISVLSVVSAPWKTSVRLEAGVVKVRRHFNANLVLLAVLGLAAVPMLSVMDNARRVIGVAKALLMRNPMSAVATLSIAH